MASGLLTGKYNDVTPSDTRFTAVKSLGWLQEKVFTSENLEKARLLKDLADELNVSLPRLSLAWCLKNPNVSTVILGASKVEQLKENLTSLEVVPLLTEEIMTRIEGILMNKPQLA